MFVLFATTQVKALHYGQTVACGTASGYFTCDIWHKLGQFGVSTVSLAAAVSHMVHLRQACEKHKIGIHLTALSHWAIANPTVPVINK